MTRDEAKKLKPGIYIIVWRANDRPSYASIGQLHDGTPWFAPCNWASHDPEGIACIDWRMVDYVSEVAS